MGLCALSIVALAVLLIMIEDGLSSLSDPGMVVAFVCAVLSAAVIPLLVRHHLRRLLDERTRSIRADKDRLERQRQAILNLANSQILDRADLQVMYREITRVAAQTLRVERVSIWSIVDGGTQIRCECQYEATSDRFSSGELISQSEYPHYFEAIRHSRVLVADNVATNPFTKDFEHLQRAGVTSMLDAPIHVNGAVKGIVCHEHVGPRRDWAIDEQNFSSSIADMVALAVEVFERRKVEDELRRKSRAIEASMEGIAIIEADETFSFVNPALAHIFGYAGPHELEGKDWRVLYDSSQLRKLERHVRVSFSRAGNLHCEAVGLRKDNTSFAQELSLTAIGDGSLVCIVRDISQRKEAEYQLVESRRFLRQVIDTVPNFIFVKDREGRFVLVNQAVADAYGTSVEKLLGKTDADFNPNAKEVERFRRDDLAVIISGKRAVIQEEFITDHAGRERVLHTVKLPLEVPGSSGMHVLGVSTDITQQRILHDQLLQSQKMEALGQLAGGIAHDFNNLMTGVLGYTTLIKLDSGDRPEVYRSADVIEHAATRAAELTQKLLGFARRGKHQNTPVDIHAVVNETLAIITRTIAPTIALHTELDAEDHYVSGDPVQLQQMVLNLTINARDAIAQNGGVGTLTIRTKNASEASEDSRSMIRIDVSDSGCGVPEHLRSKIFEPFFSTKEEANGTGLGLAMVYGIVCNHGGHIDLVSEVNVGTTFTILLPTTVVSLMQRVQASTTLPAKGKGTILVVDDHDVVRSATSDMLQSLGYTVLTAGDGAEALEVCRAHAMELDLVILDVVMPRMGAEECLRELEKLRPDLPVIISTGYTSRVALGSLLDSVSVAGFISKPFQLGRLSAVILDALQRRGKAGTVEGVSTSQLGGTLRSPSEDELSH
jgi:PAS domain S-box-containing protein